TGVQTCALPILLTSLIIFELKAPAKPLLEVIATIKTFFTSRWVENLLPESALNVALKLCKSSVNLSAYGRIAVIASCAFFNFAADTIFMALVICIVHDTDVILLRISFKLAIFPLLTSPKERD